jgi:hypothetical protein
MPNPRDVPVGVARDLEAVALLEHCWVPIGGQQHRHDHVPLGHGNLVEFDVLVHEAGNGVSTGPLNRSISSTAVSRRSGWATSRCCSSG